MNAHKPKLNFTDKLPPMTIAIDNKIIENTSQTSNTQDKKKTTPKRCQLKGCKKKLSITAFDCKCEKRFCNLHIYSENHNCTFDYKSLYKQNLIDRAELGGGKVDKVGDRV
uniref:AN1-type domain-containing protein n=1 Tax=viral metagenome TaxID=1070528 RepID=A0A6C0EME4_9ZZZZ